MRRVEASAPGKVVLIGEYAVLHGAPALVMAVNRRARVEVWACPAHACRVEAAQLDASPVPFACASDGTVRWSDPAAARPEFAFCRDLIERNLRQEAGVLDQARGMSLTIDTAELYGQLEGDPIKLGLGSSAAVSVALSAAVRAFLRGSRERPGVDELLAGYRQGQGGHGSGIDLAASLAGGVFSYRLLESGPEIEPLAWPPDWPLLFVWTGQPAATGAFLQRYVSWRAAHPKAANALFDQMADCVRHAQAAVHTGDLEAGMICVNNYRILMGKIGSLIHAPVITPEHAELAEQVAAVGAAYKPCGAGGGDLGMVLAARPEQLAAARARIRKRGFQILDLGPAVTGLELSINEH